MTTTDLVITCTARAVDSRGKQSGDPCGKTYARHKTTVGGPDPRYDGWGVVPLTDADYIARARVAGWAVHILPDGRVDVLCPTCRKPTKETVALLRDLRQSIIALPEGTT